jgi:hypothetical protein
MTVHNVGRIYPDALPTMHRTRRGRRLRPVPPRPTEIPDDVLELLDAVRRAAADDAEELALGGGTAGSLLAGIARRSVILGEDHPLTTEAIVEARTARLQWAEIAAALGLDHTDRAEARRLASRVAYRRRAQAG